MKEIIDHKIDAVISVPKRDIHVVTRRDQKQLEKITCDWKLPVKWKDQSEFWIHLIDQSLFAKTAIPHSTLKTKDQSIAYQIIREGVANNERRILYVNTTETKTDILTKQLSSDQKRREFL